MTNYLKHKPGSIEEVIANQTSKFREDSGYQKMFKKELDKAGKPLGQMTGAEKKSFFNKIDKMHKGKNENAPSMADIDRLKIWEELRDSILPDSPVQDAFDYACLYLSINPDNLDVYKGGFVRYGKVNKKKIQGYIDLAESESMDLTDCNFSKD